ncbi:MAG: hypothetical protein EBY22_10985 [Gammaproteobacteria bacterium]|nr:hypothetical protein [Gammaproteobacteria bacterium]
MAEAYGKLIFSCSKDAKFNGEKLIESLNKFTWENEGGQWITNSNNIYYDGNTIQYPTVYPLYTKFVILLINGVETKIHPSELTEEQKEFFYDLESESVPLQDLTDSVAGHIENGWIEIACIANEKVRYIYLEELRIYSDGRAYRKNSFIGNNNAYSNYRDEEFLPNKLAHKTEVS